MNIFRVLQKLNDAFFDGLKQNTTNRILSEANKKGPPKDVLKIMDATQKEKDYVDKILEDIKNL